MENKIKDFGAPEDYQAYIRENGTLEDYVIVNDMLFTMESYDRRGRIVSYGNRTSKKTMFIETEDRYQKGFEDAEVWIEKMTSYRNDINYADENKNEN